MWEVELLAILAAIYVFECAFWTRHDTIVFWAPWGRRWRWHHPGALWGNQNGSLVIGNPLPPLGPVVVTQPWPLSLSPDGVLAWAFPSLNPTARANHTEIYLDWSEVRTVAAHGKKILVNDALLAEACSPPLARHLGQLIKELSRAAREKRGALIERALRASFAADGASEALKQFKAQVGGLRFSCNMLLLYVFTAGSLLIWVSATRLFWPWLLAALFLQWALVVFDYWRAHRALYPEEKAERGGHLFMLALSPPAAMRACDVVGRWALSKHHPLAVAAACCSREAVFELARQLLLDARYPLPPECPVTDERARSVAAWSRERLVAALEQALETLAIPVHDLLAPPASDDPASRAYCPRCRNLFTSAEGVCVACGDLPLQPLPESAPAAT